jgi:hypothetical protein
VASIKIKDEAGNWVYFGGTAAPDQTQTWVDINQSTFDIPAAGGNFSVTTANDRGYVFGRLPPAPTNGTIVRVQVTDAVNYLYLQPLGTDTIDYQSAAVLARNNAQWIEAIRYYNGRWLRIDGNYPYAPPPLVGPYGMTATIGITAESSVLILGFGVSTSNLTYTTMSGLSMLTYP